MNPHLLDIFSAYLFKWPAHAIQPTQTATHQVLSSWRTLASVPIPHLLGKGLEHGPVPLPWPWAKPGCCIPQKQLCDGVSFPVCCQVVPDAVRKIEGCIFGPAFWFWFRARLWTLCWCWVVEKSTCRVAQTLPPCMSCSTGYVGLC